MTIEQMKYGIRTSHGDSTAFFCQEPGDVPLVGEIQGKADDPCIWSVESHTMLRAHRKLHKGLYLPSVDGTRAINKNSDAFVDDCNGMTNRAGDSFAAAEEATRSALQTGAQLWSDIIEGPGQAIACHKSIWQMQAFDDTTFPPTVKQVPSGQVFLHNSKGCPAEIKKLNADEPNKDLGVHLAANGSWPRSTASACNSAGRQRREFTKQTSTVKKPSSCSTAA